MNNRLKFVKRLKDELKIECNGKPQGCCENKIKIKNSKDYIEIEEKNKYVDESYTWTHIFFKKILYCLIYLIE